MINRRWNTAQRAELSFWERNPPQQGEEFWKMILLRFNMNWGSFKEKNVLEIGCGPSGIISYIPAKKKVGIDPLLISYIERFEVHGANYTQALAEKLPFKDNFFDIVICFNVLDHLSDIPSAIQEMKRVCTKNGLILIWIHVIKRSSHLITGLLNYFDRTHPHHITLSVVLNEFEEHWILEYKYKRKGFAKPYNWKIKLANIIFNTYYLRFRSNIEE